MNIKILKTIGISESEAEVYQQLLRIGMTTSGSLVKESDLQKSTIYNSLNALSKKGLVKITIKNNIQHFQAENPRMLMEMFKETEREIKEIIPKLEDLRIKKKEKIQSSVFEGYKAVSKSLLHRLSVLEKGDELLVMGGRSGNPNSKAAILLLENINKQRVKKGISMKIIFNEEIKKTSVAKTYKKLGLTRVKFAKEVTPASIAIYGDFVFTLVWDDPKKPTSILTESQVVANSYKQYFESLWNSKT